MRILKYLLPKSLRLAVRSYAWRRLNIEARLSSGAQIQIQSKADWEVFCEVFVNKEYDEAIERVLRTRAQDRPTTVLDLGANLGLFSLRVLDMGISAGIDPTSFQLCMIEASASMIAQMKRRTSWQIICQTPHEVVLGLVGDKSGKGIIHESANHLYSSINPIVGGSAIGVPFVDIEALTSAWPTIDLLKCDIQGSEEAFLKNYVTLLKKTRVAIIELHHQLCDTNACMEALRQTSFTSLKPLREDGGVTVLLCER